MQKNQFILVADNIRSLENVGSLFRIADAFAAEAIYIVGISGYPDMGELDPRRPWLKDKNTKAIRKTALTGLDTTPFQYFPSVKECLTQIKLKKYKIVCIEQDPRSIKIDKLTKVPSPCCLIFGNEVTGVSAEFLDEAELILEIPQLGKGKSLNVSVSAGIVCYLAANPV